MSVWTTALLLAALLLAVGCNGAPPDEGTVTGVVTEVSGDLTSIDSFVVLDSAGDSHKFSPSDGMTVMGAPPSHLRDHVISGEPITVIYHEGSDGGLIAADVVHG